jgi:hypothetical protein
MHFWKHLGPKVLSQSEGRPKMRLLGTQKFIYNSGGE